MSAAVTTSSPRPSPAVGGWWERPAPRLAAFGVALAVALGVGAGLGVLVGPDTTPAPTSPVPHGTTAH